MRPVLQADRVRAQAMSKTRCGFHVVSSVVDGRPIQVWCGPYADAAVLDHVDASWHAKVVRRAWELLLVAQAEYLDVWDAIDDPVDWTDAELQYGLMPLPDEAG
jgi:hypothetical protein